MPTVRFPLAVNATVAALEAPFLKVPLLEKFPRTVSVFPFSFNVAPLLMVTPEMVVADGRVTELPAVVAMVTVSPMAGLPELSVQVLAVVQEPPLAVLVQDFDHRA